MSEENKALLQRWYEEVWNNKGREEAIDEMLASDAIIHVPGGASEPIRGPASFKPFCRRFRQAFPDIRIVIEDIIAEGDRFAARCRVTERISVTPSVSLRRGGVSSSPA